MGYGTLLALPLNVLDWPGPDFLTLYVGLAIVIAAFVAWIRYAMRGPGGDAYPDPALNPYEVAALRGGTRRAVDTLIGALVYRRVLLVHSRDRRLSLDDSPLGPAAHPLEHAACEALSQLDGKQRVSAVRTSLSGLVAPLNTRLRELGLVPTFRQLAAIRLYSVLPILALMALGITKVIIGISRHRPTGFLVLLLVATAPLVPLCLFRSIPTTRRGSRHLRALRTGAAALETAGYRSSRMLDPEDVFMSVALFGFGAVADREMASLRRMLGPDSPNSSGGDSSGCSSSCSSGSSCGGSSCGGGGGGCGGCGSSS